MRGSIRIDPAFPPQRLEGGDDPALEFTRNCHDLKSNTQLLGLNPWANQRRKLLGTIVVNVHE
jgi:hypothetical protein